MPFGIQQHHTKTFEPAARTTIRAIPNNDAFNRKIAFEFHLPPWIHLLARGVGHTAFGIFSVRAAVRRTFRHGIGVRAALLRRTAQSDVFPATEDLHFGKLEHPAPARQFHPHNTGEWCRLTGGRHQLGLHFGQHEIAETRGRQRLQPQRADLSGGHRQVHGITICIAGL